ncbi:MAG: YARHG domain-containing protein [Rhizobiales bacterium]|nr:YARHG domain-containing protein [Hyphomicrobiales bacterium]MBN9009528.1 YARHG domain-containing protein [Hyphomicrobiales bacterium]
MKFASLARTAALAVAAASLFIEAAPASAANYAYMSCGQLWYARNAIYASKGFCFQKPETQSAFPNSCFPPYGKLNKWEQSQVAQIQSWERRKGCS